jgi:hypothetical protein
VTHRHFSLLAAHLVDTLDAFGVAPAESDHVLGWIAQARELVVEED